MFGNENHPSIPTSNGFNGDLIGNGGMGLVGAEGVKTGTANGANGGGKQGATAAINTMKSVEQHSSRRKKPSKTRHPQQPQQQQGNSVHYPSSLDAWLENCLKDAGNAQLSSSSEFLDFQMPNLNRINKEQSPQPQQQFFMRPKFQPQPTNYFKGSAGSSYMNKFTLPDMSQHILQPEGDFASLPPIINFIGSEHEPNSTDVLNGSNPNNSRDFRFSDPCLVNPSDNESKMSGVQDGAPAGQGTAETDSNSNNKFFLALMEQINLLHETNSKICRNLHETKVEVEALKHAPTWGLKHRRDSISGLSTHSQPMNFAFGTHSPAPTYHSGMYTPGMMTDVVREVKEAARVREDALLNRVKSMVEERTWSQSEGNMRILRDIEELKSQVQHLKSDRKESHRRIAQLETENKYIRQIIGTLLNNRSIDFLSDQARKKRPSQQPPMNLNYGIINEETSLTSLHINESPESSTKSEQNDFESPEIQELRRQLQDAMTTKRQEQSRIIAIEKKIKELNGGSNSSGSCGGGVSGIPNSNGEGHTNHQQQHFPPSHQHHNATSKFSIAGPITDL